MLGHYQLFNDPTSYSQGTLDVTSGSVPQASSLHVVNGSAIASDAAGAVVAGTRAPTGIPATQIGTGVGGSAPSVIVGAVTLDDGGLWWQAAIQIGLSSSQEGILTVSGTAAGQPTTLDTDPLVIGHGYDNSNPSLENGGLVVVSNGALIHTLSLTIWSGSDIALDPASSLLVGVGTVQPGALVVANGATLSDDDGALTGNLVVDGGLSVMASFPGVSGLSVSGGLTAQGTITLAGTLSVDNALGFTGTIVMGNDQFPANGNGDPVLSHGGASLARIDLALGTIDLRDVPPGSVTPSLDPSGVLVMGADTLDPGLAPGTAVSDLTFGSDGFGGTTITAPHMASWQASGASYNSGEWSDPSHWNIGHPPRSDDNVTINPNYPGIAFLIAATGEVMNALLLSTTDGTLVVSGQSSIASFLQMPDGTLIVEGGALSMADLGQSFGSIEVDQALLAATAATVYDAAVMDGQWSGQSLTVTHRNGLSLDASTLSLTGALAATAFGGIALTGGSAGRAGALTLASQSSVTLDATSSLVIGTGAQAGAGSIMIAGGGEADVAGAAMVAAAVADAGGRLVLGATSVAGAGPGATITGALSGYGSVQVLGAAEVASIAGFFGTLEIDRSLTVDAGAAPGGLVAFAPLASLSAPATLDLRGVAWAGGSPVYDALTGWLSLGATAIDVGAALQSESFAAQPDGSGGTEIVGTAIPCFAAGTRIRTPRGGSRICGRATWW